MVAASTPTHRSWLRKRLPILGWLPAYKRAYLPADLIAGLTLGVIAIPQSMAYALLANLPPQTGLYAAMVTPIAYAVFGTSRALSVGPMAVVALLTGNLVAQFAAPQSPQAVQIALGVALLVGLLQVVLGYLRIGFIVNFLSYPVLSGFTTAAVIVIILSQTKHLLGVSLAGPAPPLFEAIHLVEALPSANPFAVMMGGASIAVMLVFNRCLGRWLTRLGASETVAGLVARAGGLVVVSVGTLLTWLLRLDESANLQIVGRVPAGLPPLTMPFVSVDMLGAVLPSLLILTAISYVGSVSIAKSLASRQREKVDADQELIALGAANIAAAFTGGLPVSGSFARSAINVASGAVTQLSSLFAALVIACVLLFFTPLFYYLPQTVLAATIVSTVISLPDLEIARQAWRYSRADWLTLVVTLAGALLLSVEAGLLLGIVSALAVHLWITSRPHITVIGRLEGTETYKSIERYTVKTCPHVVALRIDESLYFATASALEDALLNAALDHPQATHIVLDCSAVNRIDLSALSALETTDRQLKAIQVTLVLTSVKGPIYRHLLKSGFVARFGPERFYLSTHAAMRALGCD
jgi:SulP family sulfate permease